MTTLDEREWIDQNAIASRALTPLGRRRFTLATKMLLQLRFVEPPTSTRSRPIGRTKTRVDAQNLTPFYFVFTPRLCLF